MPQVPQQLQRFDAPALRLHAGLVAGLLVAKVLGALTQIGLLERSADVLLAAAGLPWSIIAFLDPGGLSTLLLVAGGAVLNVVLHAFLRTRSDGARL